MGAKSGLSATESALVKALQPTGEIDTHENRSRQDDQSRCYLDTAIGSAECRGGNTRPGPIRVALKGFDEVVHGRPPFERLTQLTPFPRVSGVKSRN